MNMRNQVAGEAALKAIVLMGAATFAVLLLVAFGLKQSMVADERLKVRVAPPRTAFDGKRAFEDLRKLIEAAAGAKARIDSYPGKVDDVVRVMPVHEMNAVIERSLAESGFDVDLLGLGKGYGHMVVIGKQRGRGGAPLVFIARHSAGLGDDPAFAGANVNAGTACLMELARAIGPRWEGMPLCLIFWGTIQDSDSKGIVPNVDMICQKYWYTPSQEVKPAAIVYLSDIGDTYLGLFRDEGAPKWMYALVKDVASRQGYRMHFLDAPGKGFAFDEANALRKELSIPLLLLADPVYGGTPVDHKRLWHTSEDTLEQVRAASLQAVGDVLYDVIPLWDRHLKDAKPEKR